MAASENKLGALHEKVTEVLTMALDGDRIPGYTEEDPVTGEEVVVPDRVLPPSAAIIAAATKFLKDNNITCAPSQDNAVGNLVEKLREKQRSKLSKFELQDAKEAQSFMGGLN